MDGWSYHDSYCRFIYRNLSKKLVITCLKANNIKALRHVYFGAIGVKIKKIFDI